MLDTKINGFEFERFKCDRVCCKVKIVGAGSDVLGDVSLHCTATPVWEVA